MQSGEFLDGPAHFITTSRTYPVLPRPVHRDGAHLQAKVETAGPDPKARLIALGRGYVGFARASPGLFLLMFRSERLNWSSPALSAAGEAAFALLTQDEPEAKAPSASHGFQNLIIPMSRWSLVHGLSTLLIDGRLGPLADKVPGADIEVLIEQVLTRLALQEPGIF
jgi:hypothetical protein